VAAALLAVAGCSPDVRSSPDPTNASPTASGDSGAETPGNTSSPVTTAGTTPGTTTPETTPEQGERARAETAVADALTALGRQPAVTYSSRLSGFVPQPKKKKKSQNKEQNNEERPTVDLGRVGVIATASGLVHGGGTVRAAPLEMLTIDSKLYLRMGAAHWQRLGVDVDTARTFAGGWTVTSPDDVGFDPRRGLRPATLAERLAVPDDGELSYRTVRNAEGEQMYRVDVKRGTIDVSVRRPHRVTRTTVPLWDELTTGGASGNLNFGKTGGTLLSEPTALEIRYTREVLLGQRSGLGTSLLLAPSLRIRVPNVATLSCTQLGRCTITARITNRVKQEFVPATSVQVLLRGFLNGGPLGAKRCTADGLMVVNSATRVRCSVEFVVPAEGRRYDITGRVLASGFARWDPNPRSISRQIGRHATETLQALADQ
jgi:hypothetical protein